MRFGGFTEVGRARTFASVLKDQLVFGPNHKVNQITDEYIMSFTGAAHRRLTSASIVDIYYRSVSDERVKLTWWDLVGIQTTAFHLDKEKLGELIADSEPHIDEGNQYIRLRWHDVAVLLLLCKLSESDESSDMFRYGFHHITNIIRMNLDVAPEMKKLEAKTTS